MSLKARNSFILLATVTANRIFCMIVTRGIDIRLYPNKGQRNFINKMIGAVRVVYNASLYRRQKHYEETKSTLKMKFCSICCDYEVPEYEHTGNCVGLDLGIKDLIITSDGQKFENKKFLKNSEKKIKHLQRNYSRKKKGSKNQEKARLKLAIAHEKLSNKRKDNLHKITTSIVKENSVICIEDLNVKGMMKNHKLSKSISDCSFSMIRSMLDYKCKWYGRQLIVIDRWSPTSKTCNDCGYVMKDWNLGIREWTCPNCGAHHDRDINAAKNILDEGLEKLDRAGTARIEACGEQSSVSEMKCSCSAKQETDRSLVGL